MRIGILGNGFVGKATRILENAEVEVVVYDIRPNACVPPGMTLEELDRTSDLIFLCLPTPMRLDGGCDTSILDSVLSSLKNPFVVVRSTVPVGFNDKKGCFFMPEFLTEKNWADDFRDNPMWIFGLPSKEESILDLFRGRISMLFESAHRHGKIVSRETRFIKNGEAEMVKLFKNVFLATKVSFCNEMYDLCQRCGIEYDVVRDCVAKDERIGTTHLAVPGYGDRRGFGGTCFPKDSNSLYRLCAEKDVPAPVLGAILYRNEYQDNREREWLGDAGRTVSAVHGEVLLVVGDAKEDIEAHLAASPHHRVLHLDYQKATLISAIDRYFFVPTEKEKDRPLFYPRVHRILFVCEDTIPRCQLLLRVLELRDLHGAEMEIRNADCGPLSVAFHDRIRNYK
jgi:UDPglucose 6-dehydrogenase